MGLGRRCQRLLLALPVGLAGCQGLVPAPDPPRARYGPYQNLYATRFRNLSMPDLAGVREKGASRVYPGSVSTVWRACLDVLAQYDALAYLSAEHRVAVSAHGVSAFKDGPGAARSKRYYDTLLAVCMQPRGERRTAVFVAWLPPQDLEPAAVPGLPEDLDSCDFGSADDDVCRQWAAAIVAHQFQAQLSTQLLFKARWRQRFELP
jgi:hypothetical protein